MAESRKAQHVGAARNTSGCSKPARTFVQHSIGNAAKQSLYNKDAARPLADRLGAGDRVVRPSEATQSTLPTSTPSARRHSSRSSSTNMSNDELSLSTSTGAVLSS